MCLSSACCLLLPACQPLHAAILPPPATLQRLRAVLYLPFTMPACLPQHLPAACLPLPAFTLPATSCLPATCLPSSACHHTPPAVHCRLLLPTMPAAPPCLHCIPRLLPSYNIKHRNRVMPMPRILSPLTLTNARLRCASTTANDRRFAGI